MKTFADWLGGKQTPFNVISKRDKSIARVVRLERNDPLGVGGGWFPNMPVAYFENGGWCLIADLMDNWDTTDSEWVPRNQGREDLLEILSEIATVKTEGHSISVPELSMWFVPINSVGGTVIQYKITCPKIGWKSIKTKRYMWKLDPRAKYKLKVWVKQRLEMAAYLHLQHAPNEALHKYLLKPVALAET